MALKRFAKLPVTIDNVSQVLLESVTINFDSKKIPVETQDGLVGFTPGPSGITISFSSVVPVSGPEFDPVIACKSNNSYVVAIPYGPLTIYSEGEFTSGSLTGGGTESTKLSFEFMGTFPDPK